MKQIRRYFLLFLTVGLLAAGVAFSSEVFFSPNGGIRDQIIRRINTTKSTIDVAVYSFTSGEIAQALVDAEKRGVQVRFIIDTEQATNKNAEDKYLGKNGIPIKHLSGIGRGIMHDKFAVFDGKEALAGSYNWTESAEHYNHENALFTEEEKVVKGFEQEFEKLWKEGGQE